MRRKETFQKTCNICNEPNIIVERSRQELANLTDFERLEYSNGIHRQCWQLLFGEKSPGDFRNPMHEIANFMLENNTKRFWLTRSQMFKDDFKAENWIRTMYETRSED